MSIKLRVGLLLGLLLLGFATALAVVRAMEWRSGVEREALERDAQARLLNHWLDVAGRALPQFAADAALSDELRHAADAEDFTADREKISVGLKQAGLSGFWIVDPKGKVRFAVGAGEALPLPAADFEAVTTETPSPHFFVAAASVVLELAARRIQPDPRGGPLWVMVSRAWDDGQLRRISALTDSTVTLVAPHAAAEAPAANDRMVVMRPLQDWHGHGVAVLRAEHEVRMLAELAPIESRVLFIFGLLLLLAVGLALEGWVLRPLRRISESLARADPALVDPLARERSEMGRMAQLVQESFVQRSALEREVDERKRAQVALEDSEAQLRRTMEERARLGRDLHDGVIQSLYAAGMGLAGIRSFLNPEQTEAAARLEQTRAALNETIHDVRNFIEGLEPEALRQQTFTQAVHGLMDVMQAIRAVQTEIRIDESLASRLTLSQRVQALQITREAVSNALRHGSAKRIQITLQPAGHFAEFKIIDDGRGFDVNASGPGRGLTNFAQRAHELGGELVVESTPGHGASVTLTFSLLPT